MVSGPDQSNESSMLDILMEGCLLILFKMFGGTDCTIRIFQLFGAWMHSYTPQKYRAGNITFI